MSSAVRDNTTERHRRKRLWRRLKWAAATALVLYLAALIPMRMIAGRGVPDIAFIPGAADTDTLVVVVHGLNGAPSRNGMLEIVKSTDGLPNADILAPLYFDDQLGVLSNADPYQLTDLLEVRIDEWFRKKNYAHIVLVGHSMGGGILRKALVWALGQDDDRPARRPKREWPSRVDRFVSLAAINRGWSIDPLPVNMSWWRAVSMDLGLRLAAITGTAHLIGDLQRGAPYVSDLRVQWLRLARSSSEPVLPPSIHLLGTKDDIVTTDDSRDLCVAAGVRFASLTGVGHADIAAALRSTSTSPHATTIRDAIAGRLPVAAFDDPTRDECRQIPNIERLVFIVHGIRDYADWGEALETEIAKQAKSQKIPLVVEPSKYGFFPMASFLLRPDRQQKVRWFMDQYTDALATYPDAHTFDFIGHSNGTYLLGAALVRYKTLKIRNVYLAGSVLPQRFPWKTYVPRQVEVVRNVVASRDWVVGIFPRLIEQLAEWFDITRVNGFWDVGAAGFRGFSDLANGSVRNIKFAPGSHGYGVDIAYEDRKSALVRFAVDGVNDTNDSAMSQVFGSGKAEGGFDVLFDMLSRVSPLIWIALVVLVIYLGVRLWRVRWWLGSAYAGLVLFVLFSG